MGIRIEYGSASEIPCLYLRKTAEGLNSVAASLAAEGAETDTLQGKCGKCKLPLLRVELPDGRVTFMPGNGWPGKCKNIILEDEEEKPKRKNPWIR